MTTYYPQLLESRILNDSREDQSGGANGDVTNWTKTDLIILATQIGYNGKDTAASAYKLRYRDETDNPGGAFGDVGSTGEVKYATSATLGDGTAITTTTRRCTDQSATMTWQNGLESEADNLCPDSGTFDLGEDYFSEFQWSLSLADSQGGHQYTFELYNNTAGAATGTCGAQITIADPSVNVTCTTDSLTLATYRAKVDPGYGNYFLDDINCVALYRFESGALTTDEKGTNTLTNDGVAESTGTYKEGACCGDWELADTDLMEIADAALDSGFPLKSGDTTKNISVCLWINIESSAVDSVLYAKWNGSTGNQRSFGVGLIANGAARIYLGYNNGATGVYPAHATTLSVGVWYHITASYQESDHSYAIRIRDTSGNVVGTDKTGTETLDENGLWVGANRLLIGCNEDAGTPVNFYDGLIDELVVFNDIITADEATLIAQGSYGRAASVNVSATVDALTLTENTANINAENNVLAEYDTLAITENAASVKLNVNVSAQTDSLTLTAYDATVKVDENVLASTDALAITEYAATVNAEISIQAGTDALAITENSADVNLGVSVQGAVDALTLTANAANINAETNVLADYDARAITENAADVNLNVAVSGTSQALTLTANSANINAEVNVQAGTDALAITVYPVALGQAVNVSATVQNLTLTENAANVNAETSIQADCHAITLTEYQAGIKADFSLVAGVHPLILSALAANVNAENNVQAGVDDLLLAVYAATVGIGGVVGDDGISPTLVLYVLEGSTWQ